MSTLKRTSSARIDGGGEESQKGLPEKLSCGGQFRQCFYEDRRVYNIIQDNQENDTHT